MEDLQARIKASRPLPTENNLARQPYPDLDDLSNGYPDRVSGMERSGKSLPLEEATQEASSPRSSAKRKSPTKRNAQISQARSKSIPFRQLYEINQQPFADELKRLELQVDRINQLLAERATKTAQSVAPPSIDASQQAGSSAGLNQPFVGRNAITDSAPVQSVPRQDVALTLSEDGSESVEAQAARINHWLAELKPPLAQVGLTSLGDVSHTDRSDTNTAAYSPNLGHSAEQEAAETAQALRYLAGREQMTPRAEQLTARREPPTVRKRPIPAATSRKQPKGKLRTRRSLVEVAIQRCQLPLKHLLQWPRKPIDRVGDAVLWVVLSAVVRLGAQALIAAFPSLSLLLGLLVLPAVLAVYLAFFVPKAGWIPVYRLFLITLGLLIGGRF